MEEKTLKPCPFCGGEAETEFRIKKMGGNDDEVMFSVCCNVCGVRKTTSLNFPYKCGFCDVEDAICKAVEIWNWRAE